MKALLCSLIVLLLAVPAAALHAFVPTLAELGCDLSGIECSFDGSRPSQLFVYVVETRQLWKYPSNGGASTHYDLSPYQAAFGTSFVLDFVSLSDTELLFIGTQFDTYQNGLTIYNTVTNQIRKPAIDFDNIVLTECDATPSTPIDNLYVFPNSSRVLLCGVSQGQRKLIIVDIALEQIERVIDIPVVAPNSGSITVAQSAGRFGWKHLHAGSIVACKSRCAGYFWHNQSSSTAR